jgi:hypothetical protein
MMYRVLVALVHDVTEGLVWANTEGLDPRSVIRIKNKLNGRKVYCECLEIDENFLEEYNKPPRVFLQRDNNTIVMSEWYRKKLGGLRTKEEYDLSIKRSNNWWGQLCACLHHPQIVVRLAITIALMSACLRILSIILTLGAQFLD